MSEQTDVLKEVASRLDQVQIPYMVSGSIASSYFAQPRMTRDIDLVIDVNSLHEEAIIQAFKEGYYIDGYAVRDAIQNRSMFNIIHLGSMIKIDFIVRKNSPYRKKEFERRQKVRIDDDSIWFVAPEDLILSKLAWAVDSRSEIQINDVKNLIAGLSDLDWVYIEQWAPQLEIIDMLNEIRK